MGRLEPKLSPSSQRGIESDWANVNVALGVKSNVGFVRTKIRHETTVHSDSLNLRAQLL